MPKQGNVLIVLAILTTLGMTSLGYWSYRGTQAVKKAELGNLATQRQDYKTALEYYKQSYELSPNQSVSEKIIQATYLLNSPSPLPTRGITILPTDPVRAIKLITPQPKYDCIGPDGVHMSDKTKEECEAFIAAWNKPQATSKNAVNYGDLPCGNRYATTKEILAALNTYRNKNKAPSLVWNDKLAEVARMRVAQTIAGGRDYHQGFIDFTNNQDNFKKVGFRELSENIGAACPLDATALIEQKIAKSPSHDNAQKDPNWVAVGIATDQGISSFIFGRNPM